MFDLVFLEGRIHGIKKVMLDIISSLEAKKSF